MPSRVLLGLCGLVGSLLGASAAHAELRWASSTNRIYVEGGVSATLGQIHAALPRAPLELVDADGGVWLLRANLVITDGSTLLLHGRGVGGDVDELRLQSNGSPEADGFVSITADHGTIDVRATRITSWDDAVEGPDTEYAEHGRAFIRVRSKLADDGVTALESRMDIVDSDVGYLGYPAPESYGLAWKVIGSEPDLYERVQVFGDIRGSRIHHNYFGVYTYGAEGSVWIGNEIDHNVQYGLDPHDDSDELWIEDNDVHHNGNHGLIASKRCDSLVIRGNRSWANAGNGIMLHRSSDDALVEDNQTFDNGDSGIAMLGSSRATIRRNVILNNANAGVRFSVGAAYNVVRDNEIGESGKYAFFFYRGQDEPEPGSDGRPARNTIIGNLLHGERVAIKVQDAEVTQLIGNRLRADSALLRFEESRENVLVGNELPLDTRVVLRGSSSVGTSLLIADQPLLVLDLDRFSSVTALDDLDGLLAPLGGLDPAGLD